MCLIPTSFDLSVTPCAPNLAQFFVHYAALCTAVPSEARHCAVHCALQCLAKLGTAKHWCTAVPCEARHCHTLCTAVPGKVRQCQVMRRDFGKITWNSHTLTHTGPKSSNIVDKSGSYISYRTSFAQTLAQFCLHCAARALQCPPKPGTAKHCALQCLLKPGTIQHCALQCLPKAGTAVHSA